MAQLLSSRPPLASRQPLRPGRVLEDEPADERRAFQFSVRWLLVAIALVAVDVGWSTACWEQLSFFYVVHVLERPCGMLVVILSVVAVVVAHGCRDVATATTLLTIAFQLSCLSVLWGIVHCFGCMGDCSRINHEWMQLRFNRSLLATLMLPILFLSPAICSVWTAAGRLSTRFVSLLLASVAASAVSTVCCVLATMAVFGTLRLPV